MKRPKITSTTVFPKLEGILKEDVSVLERMNSDHIEDSKYREFINSLINAKNKILGLIPSTGEGISESPAPAQKLHIVGIKNRAPRDLTNLFSAIKDTEVEQMKFVRNAVVDEGMPNELLGKLEKILKIYEDITEQLGRSYKTKQFNPIVV
ncbi:hypothetical protein [Portibacter lacus]|nr:hypothetical protein [Portibacter lacus]